jgi:3-dehydroquinate synthase
MMAAGRISRELGLLSDDLLARQGDLLRAFGLPLTAPGADHRRISAALSLDKKIEHGKRRFVLLEDVARPVIRDDVPEDLVDRVIREIVRG